MLTTRVIPVLLLNGRGLYKTVRFRDPRYVGDPVNTVRIFNDKEVDEIAVLDIAATREGRGPALDLVAEIASEAFMPMCYGGGVRTLDEMRAMYGAGIEKVALNSQAVAEPDFVRRATEAFGSQSVVVSIDVVRRRRGYEVVSRCGTQATGLDPVAHAIAMEAMGAGEILLTAIDRDGTGEGYDLDLVGAVSAAVDVPVIASGGAGSVADLAAALRAGADAVAAGSMFVFHGRHRAVLISYLSGAQREQLSRAH